MRYLLRYGSDSVGGQVLEALRADGQIYPCQFLAEGGTEVVLARRWSRHRCSWSERRCVPCRCLKQIFLQRIRRHCVDHDYG